MIQYSKILSELVEIRHGGKTIRVHQVELSALIDEDTFEYIMPSISFALDGNHESLDNPHLQWDNPNYIFGPFKDYLLDILTRNTTREQLLEFKDIAPFLQTKEEVQEILAMLKVAEKQHWYKPIEQAVPLFTKNKKPRGKT